METNDVNPLNLLAFTLKDSGKYLFDAIVLFSDNIILDETTGTVHALVNDNIKYILNNREKYLTPLQERGMKVILAITPYHTHAGVANLKPATADAFAKELKIICACSTVSPRAPACAATPPSSCPTSCCSLTTPRRPSSSP